MFVYLLLSIVFQIIQSTEDDAPIVKTSNGLLKGKFVVSRANQTGYAYLNIPFAVPPLGNLRFRKPEPAKSWQGLRDATQYGPACISTPKKSFGDNGGPVSEDCLQLNVFTNHHCMAKKGCAVLVNVYGGKLLYGTAITITEGRVMDTFVGYGRNIVVATLQYRMGISGMLNLAPKSNSSHDLNVSLWDLHLGLLWIQSEIAYFGGDAARVTVLGHSAGGQLVDHLALSPVTTDLFNQVIIMSGHTDAGIVKTIENNHLYSVRGAKIVGCAKEDTNIELEVEKILECLRQVPADVLLQAQTDTKYYKDLFGEVCMDGPNGFLPDTIQNLRKRAKPRTVLIGTVIAEMRMSLSSQDDQGKPILERAELLCDILVYGRNYSNVEIAKKICVDYYNRDEQPKMFQDNIDFYVEAIDMMNSLSGYGSKPSYMYSFSYSAGKSFLKYVEGKASPSHAEDFIYIFGRHRSDSFGGKDYDIERLYSGLLANFVNYGDPSYEEQKWNQWTPDGMEYFEINFDENFHMPGNKKNYYREANQLLNHDLPMLGGPANYLSIYPEGYDMYGTYETELCCESNWTLSPQYKLLETELLICQDFKDFIQSMKNDRKHSVLHDMTLESYQLPESTSSAFLNWFTFLAVVSLLIVFIAICSQLSRKNDPESQSLLK